MSLDPARVAAFYGFMLKRESIRLRRAVGLPREQWTDDVILQSFSFTNVKRINDRVTTLLWREFYSADRALHDATPHEESLHFCRASLLNCALFRYFGTIQTARLLGWSEAWTDNLAMRIQHAGLMDDLRFTSAYIVPNCGSTAPKYEIVIEIMSNLWKSSEWILDTNRWEEMCDRMCTLWGVGPFMAKEVLLDYILCTGWVPADWHSWTPVGPGGCRGAGRVRDGYLHRLSGYEALLVIRELYDLREAHWPPYAGPSVLGYESSAPVKMVTLDLTDIQFQLCEFDKYSRVAEGRRPKRLFNPTTDDVTVEPVKCPKCGGRPEQCETDWMLCRACGWSSFGTGGE